MGCAVYASVRRLNSRGERVGAYRWRLPEVDRRSFVADRRSSPRAALGDANAPTTRATARRRAAAVLEIAARAVAQV